MIRALVQRFSYDTIWLNRQIQLSANSALIIDTSLYIRVWYVTSYISISRRLYIDDTTLCLIAVVLNIDTLSLTFTNSLIQANQWGNTHYLSKEVSKSKRMMRSFIHNSKRIARNYSSLHLILMTLKSKLLLQHLQLTRYN